MWISFAQDDLHLYQPDVLLITRVLALLASIASQLGAYALEEKTATIISMIKLQARSLQILLQLL